MPDQLSLVRALSFVNLVRLYGSEDTAPASMAAITQPMTGGELLSGQELKMITYDVVLHQKDDLQRVVEWLQSHSVNIAGASGKKIRLYLLENSPLLGEISALPEAALIQQFVPQELHNDVARSLLGIDTITNPDSPSSEANSVNNIAETGNDQIVAIADSGIDDSHPDFKGRIVGIAVWGRRSRNDHSDPVGHGTHVAGSVLGDGSASEGKIRGTAPKAKLFFQSLLDDSGGLGGIPLNLSDLFNEAYNAGARISSNSYGAPTTSVYYITSMEIDDFS